MLRIRLCALPTENIRIHFERGGCPVPPLTFSHYENVNVLSILNICPPPRPNYILYPPLPTDLSVINYLLICFFLQNFLLFVITFYQILAINDHGLLFLVIFNLNSQISFRLCHIRSHQLIYILYIRWSKWIQVFSSPISLIFPPTLFYTKRFLIFLKINVLDRVWV